MMRDTSWNNQFIRDKIISKGISLINRHKYDFALSAFWETNLSASIDLLHRIRFLSKVRDYRNMKIHRNPIVLVLTIPEL